MVRLNWAASLIVNQRQYLHKKIIQNGASGINESGNLSKSKTIRSNLNND